MKTEPTAEMRAAATMTWQMYTAFLDAGFSETQSLEIVAQMIAQTMRPDNNG